jgi:stage V sporulation protein G
MFQITDVKISLNSEERGKLKAIATMTLDNVFVVRDLKIIDGKKGLFVAMPCAQLTERCQRCGRKNPIQSKYCTNCGENLQSRNKTEFELRKEEYRDIAHPICKECREYIENTIVVAYKEKSASMHIHS